MEKIFDLSGTDRFATGASGGLGRHFAGVLAAAGVHVSLGARRAGALAESVARVGEGRASAFVTDNTDRTSVESALDAAAGSAMTGSVVAVDGGHSVSKL